MPKNTRYPDETKSEFKKRQKKNEPFKGEGHYKFDPKKRARIREAIMAFRQGASQKEIRKRVQGLRKESQEPTTAAVGQKPTTPDAERIANIRVRVRALLGKQKAEHGLATGRPGARKKRRKPAGVVPTSGVPTGLRPQEGPGMKRRRRDV
jgi:hypothetical protein